SEYNVGLVLDFDRLFSNRDYDGLTLVELRSQRSIQERGAVSYTALSRMSNLQFLILVRLDIIIGEGQHLILSQLRNIHISECRLSRGITYDLVDDICKYSPETEEIYIAYTVGERRIRPKSEYYRH